MSALTSPGPKLPLTLLQLYQSPDFHLTELLTEHTSHAKTFFRGEWFSGGGKTGKENKCLGHILEQETPGFREVISSWKS